MDNVLQETEYKILNKNISSQSIKNMDKQKLEQLADELRQEILKVVAHNGGHLASNLGAVELTIALQRVFDLPRDKIVWDVGHQSYAHKILTGRLQQFATLRQKDGLSGFPKRSESDADCFGTGHSSTSISAALGLIAARDLLDGDYSVAAVIGDGALTGGMAWEALNNVSNLCARLKHDKNLIIILNDNEMSISRNVGAFPEYLSRVRTNPRYFHSKERIRRTLKKTPGIGSPIYRFLARWKESLKYLLVPKMLFEDLDITYLGPIDGHNIEEVSAVLRRARLVEGPVLIHLYTKKGKGYIPAEQEPDRFHGIGPFDIETGRSLKKPGPPAYTQIFGDTLVDLAGSDDKIVAITAAMPQGTGLLKFRDRFPNRYYDVGIAEQHAVTFAAGLAAAGLHPVVAVYSTFLQRAYDQVLHDICLQDLPVILAIDRSGPVGEDGPTHHGLFEYSFLRAIPNLSIMCPRDEDQLRHMLKTAAEASGPAAVCYPRGKGWGVPLIGDPRQLPLGKAELLRSGEKLAILAIGRQVMIACAAADSLQKQGINITVADMRFLKPLDEEMIMLQARQNDHLLLLEDHMLAGGFGSAVLEVLQQKDHLDVNVRRVGFPDRFIEHGNVDQLLSEYGLDADNIENICKTMLTEKRFNE